MLFTNVDEEKKDFIYTRDRSDSTSSLSWNMETTNEVLIIQNDGIQRKEEKVLMPNIIADSEEADTDNETTTTENNLQTSISQSSLVLKRNGSCTLLTIETSTSLDILFTCGPGAFTVAMDTESVKSSIMANTSPRVKDMIQMKEGKKGLSLSFIFLCFYSTSNFP